ncbi:4081_t:CDS:2 [Entrophospora sp. SA101]|nr:4081_t:CDS:2 [Entrophospora sp. SA101]
MIELRSYWRQTTSSILVLPAVRTVFQCTRVPEYESSRVPGYQSPRVPVFQGTSVPGYQCSRVPVSRAPEFLSMSVSMFQCTNGTSVLVPEFLSPRVESTSVPEYESSRVREFQSTRVPEYERSRVPEYQRSRVPAFLFLYRFSWLLDFWISGLPDWLILSFGKVLVFLVNRFLGRSGDSIHHYHNILTESHGTVGLITLNRPRQLNALSSDLFNDVNDALEKYDSDPGN